MVATTRRGERSASMRIAVTSAKEAAPARADWRRVISSSSALSARLPVNLARTSPPGPKPSSTKVARSRSRALRAGTSSL
jgi:hypothetical protein